MSTEVLQDIYNYGCQTLRNLQGNTLSCPAPLQRTGHSAAPSDQLLRSVWLQSILEENDSSHICLTASLASEVFHHVAMNFDPLYASVMPQILILNGAFGTGKTAGLAETLRRCGCSTIRIEAAEMESPHAGTPAQLVRERYIEASERQSEDKEPCVLIMEDIHLAFGTDGDTTKTINTGLMIATLMGFCDAPDTARGTIPNRIPILATTNDLTKVHGGLIRPGRTRVIAIEPSEAERKQIVMHILRDLLSPDQAARLFDARPAWSVAAFRQLKAELLRRSFDSRQRGKTAQQIIKDLIMGRGPLHVDNAGGVPITQEDINRGIRAIDAEGEAKRDFTK